MAALVLQPVTLAKDEEANPPRRVMSFGRRRTPREAASHTEGDTHRKGPAGARRASIGSTAAGGMLLASASAVGGVVRTLSFGRAARKPNATREHHPQAALREVTLVKPAAVPLGMTLCKPAVGSARPEGGERVLIASIVQGGIVAKTKRVAPGDGVEAVNGVKVRDYKHASQLLREAQGVIQLVISTSMALPEGWDAHTDAAGQTYYTNTTLQLKTYDHPACPLQPLRGDDATPDDGSPAKRSKPADATSRWRAAFHTISLVNSLAGETERHDIQRRPGSPSADAEVPNVVRSAMAPPDGTGKGLMLQRERV